MPMTQKEMVKLLKKNGLHIVPKQGKGSHIKMTKQGLHRPITIPQGELSKRTEFAILKQAGLR
ncbi:MAG: type II toxin-antitoxin system HicA family toxin [Streptococcaceae bacterium]|jgi:predicted RNA binding protein YcfA (HicA-like mRNA interferase family)|nr:type II toxin-antitoxin system HicA family toxin [Streptococcaceae bacterium]